jgi:hypothetical protein
MHERNTEGARTGLLIALATFLALIVGLVLLAQSVSRGGNDFCEVSFSPPPGAGQPSCVGGG